jgi:peroxiredoxin family protein
MSMDMMGLKREDLIEGLEEPAGAATVLQMISRGAAPIFI